MKPYKVDANTLKSIKKAFEAALEKYSDTTKAFDFNFKPTTPKTKTKIKMYCMPTAWCKIHTLVQKTDTEIAWHLLISKINKNQYIITDVLVYPQTVTSVTVNTDDTKYALWVNELNDEDFGCLRGQGHSHVNMGVEPSSVDTNYYKDLLSTMKEGFYFFMIVNKKNNMFLQFVDITNNVIYETNDIIFEIASKTWKQQTWYDKVIKKI